MKNLLNCHSFGLHSFPISFENGLYKRVFYASESHNLWKPIELAIHSHHVDIKITVLDGRLYNPIYKIRDSASASNRDAELNAFEWKSHILNGSGGFEYVGKESLQLVSFNSYREGESVTMKACELHPVQVSAGEKCVWMIEESVPTCDYFPVNYSPYDLTKWTPVGLYIEVCEGTKKVFLAEYMDKINKLQYADSQ